jgi:4-cresol dehydrogenase (hydroxylating)
MAVPKIISAISAWRSLIGADFVLSDAQEMHYRQRATFSHGHEILATLCINAAAEIPDCLAIAERYGIVIYTISQGKNWGMGSAVPSANHCVIMDLSGINRILDFNEKFGYMTIEPGVTFAQVDQYLATQQSNLFLAETGGPPHGSVMGNSLERGDGGGPCGDRANNIAGLDVILANGEKVSTGFKRFENCSAAALNRHGVGPDITGLFFQSNFGIVTQMTIWLQPKPAFYQGFSCSFDNDDCLPAYLDSIQQLTLAGLITPCSFTLWNSYKVIAKQAIYPWHAADGKTPLPRKILDGYPAWTTTGSLFSQSKAIGLAQREYLQNTLQPHVEHLHFFDSDNPPSNIESFEPGGSTGVNLHTVYWRKKYTPPPLLDPDRDRCGIIWLCPVLPFDGSVITNILRACEDLALSRGFEAHIGLNPTSGRSVNTFITLIYDRDVEGEDKRAMDCHDELFELLQNKGHLPYRMGLQSFGKLNQQQGIFPTIIERLKQTLDPKKTLSPGRYEFSTTIRDKL